MCRKTYLQSVKNLWQLSKRYISSQQAAVALRSFYFAVHPDRFANNDEARRHNEKALQQFNGYLNGLQSSQSNPQAVNLSFYIRDGKEKALRKVELTLCGSDISFIIRKALEICGLPTTNLPPKPSRSIEPHVHRYTDAEVDVAQYVLHQFKRKSSHVRSDNLEAGLNNLKGAAIKTSETHRKMLKHLEEEVNVVKKQAGMTEVVWTVDWTIGHMRRCLVALSRLIEHSHGTAGQNPIIDALKGYPLRFGRGSFVCCDGGIRLGVDSVPEEWVDACQMAMSRRQQLPLLDVAKRELSSLFGRADIVIPKEHSLAQSLAQMQMLISSIAPHKKEQRMRLKCLGMETVVEVVTSYDEFALGKDGRLRIPCNAKISHLLDFLAVNASLSRTIAQKMRLVQGDLEILRRECMNDLRLKNITWHDGVNKEELVHSLKRLKKGSESLRSLLHGTALHFSSNPAIHVMSDGRLSLPLSWT